jgi:hypothetical protein
MSHSNVGRQAAQRHLDHGVESVRLLRLVTTDGGSRLCATRSESIGIESGNVDAVTPLGWNSATANQRVWRRTVFWETAFFCIFQIISGSATAQAQ